MRLQLVHYSFPQIRYTNSEDRVKNSMATRTFFFIFKRSIYIVKPNLISPMLYSVQGWLHGRMLSSTPSLGSTIMQSVLTQCFIPILSLDVPDCSMSPVNSRSCCFLCSECLSQLPLLSEFCQGNSYPSSRFIHWSPPF